MLIYQGIINLLELMAALMGTYYVLQYREDKPSRYFIYFLWFTVFIEFFFGWIPNLVSLFEGFSFLKGTFLERNYWIYNIYFIISYFVYIWYFMLLVNSTTLKNTLKVIAIFYVISSLFNLAISNVLFESYASYTFMLGTAFVFIGVAFYFFEILQSDKILSFYKSASFYISIGALVFHLAVTPLVIYSKYFSLSKSPEFVEVYAKIFFSANIFLYTCYTIGFIICSKKKKSYS